MKNKKIILVTGTSSGIGKQIKSALIKDNRFEQQIFHSRICSNKCVDDNVNKYFFGNLEDFSGTWLDVFDFRSFSTIIFVNNASTIEPINKFKDISMDLLKKSIFVNTLAAGKISHYLMNHKKKHSKLIIFNISSGASSHPIDGWSSYCSTKAATKMMLDVINLENEDISVCHHDPGIVDTNMQQKIRSSNKKQMTNIEYFRKAKLVKAREAAKRILEEIDNMISI